MGAYITKADILEQVPEVFLVQLTDDNGAEVVNDARVAGAIADAEGEVDGYLSAKYALPLVTVPVAIKKFATDIAVYNLYSRKDTVPPDREKRYENAVKYLSNVAKGVVNLGLPQSEPPVNDSSGGATLTGKSRVFTRDKMGGF